MSFSSPMSGANIPADIASLVREGTGGSMREVLTAKPSRLTRDSIVKRGLESSPHESYAAAVEQKPEDLVRKHHRDKAEDIAILAFLGLAVVPTTAMAATIAGVKLKEQLQGKPDDTERSVSAHGRW
jgi:hypothetical protein